MRSSILTSFILLVLIFVSCSDDRPVKDFYYPHLSLSPSEKVSNHVHEIKTFYCNRYYQEDGRFIPSERSCKLYQTATYNKGLKISKTSHDKSIDSWFKYNYEYSNNILVKEINEGQTFGEKFSNTNRNIIKNGKIGRTEFINQPTGRARIYKFEYDKKGYLVKRSFLTDPNGPVINSIKYRYNSRGDISRTRGSSNEKYSYVYERNRWIQRDSGSHVTYREYDSRGNLIDERSYKDGEMQVHRYWVYDKNNLLLHEALKTNLYVDNFFVLTHYDQYDIYGNWRVQYETVNGVLNSEITKREIFYH